jgi:hypothetical protein
LADAFLRLSAKDRRDALGVAVDQSGRPAHLLEKDVWVVWALAALYGSPLGEHLGEYRALRDSHHSLLRQTGIHPQLAAQAALGIVLFCLGFPDQALAQSSKAIAEARSLPHPPSLAMSLGIDALLLSIIGDDIGLEQRADGLVAFATDQGFPFYRATGAIFRGWVKAKNADVRSRFLDSALRNRRSSSRMFSMPRKT